MREAVNLIGFLTECTICLGIVINEKYLFQMQKCLNLNWYMYDLLAHFLIFEFFFILG